MLVCQSVTICFARAKGPSASLFGGPYWLSSGPPGAICVKHRQCFQGASQTREKKDIRCIYQGASGCTPNSVPIVFIVFSRDSWGL